MNNNRTTRYILEAIEDPILEKIIVRYKLIESPFFHISNTAYNMWSILYTVNNEFEIQQHKDWNSIVLTWNPSSVSIKYAHFVSSDAIVAWELHD